MILFQKVLNIFQPLSFCQLDVIELNEKIPANKFDIILYVQQKYYTTATGMRRMKTVDFASNRTLYIARSHRFIEFAAQNAHKVDPIFASPTLTKYWFRHLVSSVGRATVCHFRDQNERIGINYCGNWCKSI